ncbi:MAG TPA: hypothetical protein VK826_17570 [Bacteroidia bacterium]|nr:hypothetical protein [Bacteroidia bacterium]
MKAQLALSAELLVAYPMYFDREEVGITSDNFQKGFRLGGYFYGGDLDDPFNFVIGFRFTHHFTTTDSAQLDVSDRNYDHFMIHGTAKTVFNSFVPQLGIWFKGFDNPLLSYRFTLGIGASSARCLYDFPTFDSLTMHYFNPPWYANGRRNEEGKLFAVRPCMGLNFAILYEFRYFFAYGNADLSYSMGEFPPTPISIGAGILFPLSNIPAFDD